MQWVHSTIWLKDGDNGLDVIFLHFPHFSFQCRALSTFPFIICTVEKNVNNAAEALYLKDHNDIRGWWLDKRQWILHSSFKPALLVSFSSHTSRVVILPCGSAFLKAFPASMKLVAASCLLCIWRWRRAAWENAFPAAGKKKKLCVGNTEVSPKKGKGNRDICSFSL